MSKFRVIVEPQAFRNADAILAWLGARSPQGAASWYRAYQLAIRQLQESADRFPEAVESRHFDAKVCEVFFRTRRGRYYRMLFTLVGDEAHVLYVRGPGQDFVAP